MDACPADAVRSPRSPPVLLTRWTQALRDRLRLGDARPDGFASLQWRRAHSRERWLRLRVPATDGPADHALAIEFLLLTQRLVTVDADDCAQQALLWLTEPASTKPATTRLQRCCTGGCRLPGADPEPVPLSPIAPCVRHAVHWRRPDNAATSHETAVVPLKKQPVPSEDTWTLGIVLDFEGAFDPHMLALLHHASDDPLGDTHGLSDEFKRVYRQLGHGKGASAVRLHVRLSMPTPTTETLRNVATSLCTWQLVRRLSFSLNGLDVAASSLNAFLAATPSLPFHKLLVCASSSLASRMDPLATPTPSLDDTSLRLVLLKSQQHLLELEVCNVRLTNFDCIVEPFTTGACQLQTLRLREFSMGVVSTGGIFAALRDPFHPIAQTLETLEIDQALHSAGGLSLWLEREAGEMLLKNDRLVTCYIRQACSMYPSSTHKGFWQTRGCEIHVPVPPATVAALVAASPIKLPRDVTERILELAGRRATRDAQMHYRFIRPDQLYDFTRDLEAWKPQRAAPFECLPYGSYYH